MSENRTHESEHDVIIAGAGPNGLMLACELALGGIRPVVLDPLPGPSDEPKANGLVGQVVRLLDMRGLYPGFAAELARLGFPDGRVLLLGDAAHVHSAIGGPGLNLGLQDAVNLGWKLAAYLRGTAPHGLLDTYESERRPVAERVILHSLSRTALLAPGPEVTALRELFAELLEIPQVAGHIGHLLAGSDVRYDVGDNHPLAGRLVPDLAMETADGTRRVADLLHNARPLLLDLGAGVAATAGNRDDLAVVTATSSDTEATALLIRPDGYIAWATDDASTGLQTALDRWLGPTRPAPPHII